MSGSNNSQIQINASTLVCQDSIIEGKVTIGSGNILHHRCRIIARRGPIIIGDKNIFEEHSTIINNGAEPMIIGNENLFETSSYVDTSNLGNQNIVEIKATVQQNTKITNNTIIGIGTTTLPDMELEELSVIYGEENSLRKQFKPVSMVSHSRHLHYLKDNLNRYKHNRRQGH
ncbi:trimeric LpxA-like protein [Conidiobolus coronatus NRRL 28638]|uniref:Dynactin subunit 6 n=1 Tax=Conidiobolus coronatus (strain ATCC 28846 / CBS 209.66 / NRRL 28638) TaxID=796925 RepID=A0A137PHX8_CONC2|nr:trimeric LpxA-like protein [Conidiobolus coronatus NRRL 28638]|eukprot:KXN74614.1 trimeric LpxA-like protein [Conidiobolus coronatus NRRL 28638]